MSYVVLARRWRPQLFEELIGQKHITQTLIKAIEAKRIGHAYLFTGPRGTGKTSTARILSKALNCHEGLSPRPCNKCPSCKEISEGISIDVLEIDGASNRGIDEIRELRANVKYASARDRFKIYIIDEVHMLTQEAFNALLKTLEEPPEHVKFIFATTSPHKIPLTILSRCQRFDFRRISVEDMTKRLKEILSAEKVKATDDALFAIVRNASGSMRDAESILDQLISFSGGKIKTEDVETLLGMVDQQTFLSLAEAVIENDTPSALKIVDQIINEGKDMEQFIKSWQQYWRDILMIKISSSELVELPEPSRKQLAKQTERISEENIFRIIETLTRTKELLRRSASSRIPVEIAVAEMTRADNEPKGNPSPQANNPSSHHKKTNLSASGTETAANHSKESEPEITTIPSAPKEPTPQAPTIISPPEESASGTPNSTVATTISIDEVITKWPFVLENLKKEKLVTSAFLMEGKPIQVDGGKLAIAFGEDFSFHRDSCERKENKKLIEKILQDVFKNKLELQCVIDTSPKEQTKSKPKPSPPEKEKVDETILKDPIVRKTMEIFNVKILEVKEEGHAE